MKPTRLIALIAAAAAVLTVASMGLAADEAGKSPALGKAPKCNVFPSNNQWNVDVSKLPKHSKSNTYIKSIGRNDPLHPDLGSGKWDGGRIGIPINYVSGKQKRSRVKFEYADESDKGPYSIPRKPKIEAGSDRHIITVDKKRCKLYELFDARKGKGKWRAGSGAIFDLGSNKLRPAGWTSADAAGLPILPGLIRYEEVRRGEIDHAVRFTVERTQRAYVYPARHYASDSRSKSLPPMGLRVRLKSSYDTSGFPHQARTVLNALKRYGMLLADNGGDWFISGEPNPDWDNDDLRSLKQVKGKHFEVVDTSSLPKPGL